MFIVTAAKGPKGNSMKTKRNLIQICLLVAVALLTPAKSKAQADIVSTFDTDADGWTVEILDSTFLGNPPRVLGPGPLSYNSTGGNPGGCISTVDESGYSEPHFVAPAKFLGNKSAYYGGVLSFDQADNLYDWGNFVELIGNGHTLFYNDDTLFNAANTWTNWFVPLAPSPGWQLDGYSAANTNMPTAADFQLVLSNLQELNISGDLANGNDNGYLDNVRMSAAIPAQIQSPLLAGTNFTFNFSTVSGQSYTVQQNMNLATTNWIFCTNIIGNGSLYQFQTPVSSNHQQFFRVSAP
jgi:alkaline phosphatase D